jgi:hypothetical protein
LNRRCAATHSRRIRTSVPCAVNQSRRRRLVDGGNTRARDAEPPAVSNSSVVLAVQTASGRANEGPLVGDVVRNTTVLRDFGTSRPPD